MKKEKFDQLVESVEWMVKHKTHEKAANEMEADLGWNPLLDAQNNSIPIVARFLAFRALTGEQPSYKDLGCSEFELNQALFIECAKLASRPPCDDADDTQKH